MKKLKDFLSPKSSFGYHTDLHLGELDLDAGAGAIPDELEKSLRILMPDWVQVDGKGHRGYTAKFPMRQLPLTCSSTLLPHGAKLHAVSEFS